MPDKEIITDIQSETDDTKISRNWEWLIYLGVYIGTPILATAGVYLVTKDVQVTKEAAIIATTTVTMAAGLIWWMEKIRDKVSSNNSRNEDIDPK